MYNIKYPLNVAARLLVPTQTKVNGVMSKEYIESDIFFCSARAFGGTEKTIDGVYVVEDTLNIETLYNPNIKQNCRIKLLEDNSEWEIITPPENMLFMNTILKFKVRRIKGGA